MRALKATFCFVACLHTLVGAAYAEGIPPKAVTESVHSMTREECRSSREDEIAIRCIQMGVYDPCSDEGGKWGAAQCARAHTEIAERRIKKAEEVLASLLKNGDAERAAHEKYQESQKVWISFRESYCRFTNSADDLKEFESQFLHYGYCRRRLTEQRADEMESLLKYSVKE